ncbi:hypothetical protein QFC20_001247 [Naganishia adeliensis]|uniref:Uncharacterized protein n=1 Tax=Naganishia adeliensis TaxID=92952 RepID=A0ACC2WU91_9TREE|nr:hypothetical protein QFC20_001247 [Naganishia adeliensis]
MRLTLRLAAAVVIGVYTLTLPSVQASPLPIREATRATVRGSFEIGHKSSVSNAFRNIASFLSPYVRLFETFEPKTGMGNRPRGFCATCLSPTDTTPSVDRVVEPNTAALQAGLTNEESNRVMDDSGRSWVKREAPDVRGLTEDQGNRVMDADSQRWGRGFTKGEADRVMDDNGKPWSRRTPNMVRDALQISKDNHWGKRAIHPDRSTDSPAQERANQIPAFDKRFTVYEGPTRRPSRPNDGKTSDRNVLTVRALEGPQDDRVMEADGARWTKRVDGRGVCNGCIQEATSMPRSTGPDGQAFHHMTWSRISERANVDFDWSKRQGSTSDLADSPSDRPTQPDGFIMVDKRINPESRSQGLSERVARDGLATGARKREKREVSDILWEFIPEGQSRIGRT